MEIEVAIPEPASRQAIGVLKDFIDRASIDGLIETWIPSTPDKPGEMGVGDVLPSIKMILEAAGKPLVELVRCLAKYVENYRTTIIIPTKNGNIELKHGRSMTPAQLQELVTAIQKNVR